MQSAIAALMIFGLLSAATAYQPESNVTRGIYCHPRGAMSSTVWSPFRAAGEFVTDEKHGGECSLKCDNTGGARGSGCGMGQTVELNQEQAKPLKISGWSKARDVPGNTGYEYSLYVDLVYTDGESWAMQLAKFNTGTHDWEYTETIIEPEKPLRSARFHAFIREKPGVVWFDDLFFGEPDGENLLRNPGFEKETRVDESARKKLLAEYEDLNANAMHIYLSPNRPLWESELLDKRYEGESPLAEFLRVMKDRGIGVWVTLGSLSQPFKDADDPRFPIYHCPNGKWGENWVAAVGDCARNDLAGISLTPDEYNYTTGYLKRGYGKHADERVSEFYNELPNYCDCPECREKFKRIFGTEMPDLHKFQQTEDWRKYINFRYITTNDWLRRTAAAVKDSNPQCRADSLICVTPVCSDRWWSVGLAWDEVGYGTQIDFLTTDPYIELHNYLGDSTHWYVTETCERLSGAHPKRQCGSVLEASRLRKEFRELDPVEVYGSALTSVFHGAKELAWWHHSHITGASGTALNHEKTYAIVKGTYQLLREVDPWLEDLTPLKRVALLHSRASEDWWRFYSSGEEPHECLTHKGKDARYASRAQVEVLMHCLRSNIPVDLYYLESVKAEQLEGYPVVVVPFPFAISDEQVKMLEEIAKAGKAVLVISEFGTVTADGRVRERPALLEFLGLKSAPSGEQTGRFQADRPEGLPLEDEATTYARIEIAAGVKSGVKVNGVPAVLSHALGAGRVIFMAGEFGVGLPESYENEIKGREQRVYPPRHRATHSGILRRVYTSRLGGEPRMADIAEVTYEGDTPEFPDDVEVVMATNAGGDLICLCTNWTSGAAELKLNVDPEKYDVGAAVGKSITSEATVSDVGRGLVPRLSLAPQEACVIRVPRKDAG